jgi:hypothetical protein
MHSTEPFAERNWCLHFLSSWHKHAHGKPNFAPLNTIRNLIMLKKLLTQFVAVSAIAACAIFATGCGDEMAEDANDDEGEGEGEFEMGDEPTGGEEK